MSFNKQHWTEEAIEKMKQGKVDNLLSKMDFSPYEEYLDIVPEIGQKNRMSKPLTLRQFREALQSGRSLVQLREDGFSRDIVGFYSSLVQGKIPLDKKDFAADYASELNLDDISKKYGIIRSHLTYLRELYGVKATNSMHKKERMKKIRQAQADWEKEHGVSIAERMKPSPKPDVPPAAFGIDEPEQKGGPIPDAFTVDEPTESPPKELSDHVVCRICGQQFKYINSFHLGKHGITSEQYLSKFSGAELTSELTRTKRSKAVGKSWKNNAFQGRKGIPLSTESKELLSQKMMGHPVSEETRRKIGETGLGRVPWNFQHTKHDEPRLMQMSHKIAAWNKSTDTPARRKRISDTLKKKYADGMPLPNAKSGFREDLGMYFRSSWEANYARSLKLDGKEILYETDHISLYENGELDSVYTPDFKTGENHYVEVKGHAESKDLWSCNCKRCERDKRKMEMTRQQYPHLTIEILGKKEYGELREEFEFTIPNWERKALQGKARSSIE